MAWSGGDLKRATEAAAALLEALGLDAYLFAVEPREGEWELKLECALKEGWQTIALPVDRDLLLASRTDSNARGRLLQSWSGTLAACLKSADRESPQEVRMPKQPTRQRRAPAARKGEAQTSIGPAAGPGGPAAVSPEERQRMVAEAAYFRAERRGFAVGGELDDWVEAEGEIDRLIERGGSHSKHSLRHM